MRSIQLFASLFVLVICVSISYGQESEKKAEGDKADFAKAAEMLHGVWAGDAEKTAEEIKKMEDPELEESMEMLLERVKSIELDFKDGTFHVDIGDQAMVGKWEVTKVEKKDETQTMTIHVMPDEAEGMEKKFEIHFMGKKYMKMIDLDEEGPPFVMARKEVRAKDQ